MPKSLYALTQKLGIHLRKKIRYGMISHEILCLFLIKFQTVWARARKTPHFFQKFKESRF